ncbi:MAG: hypothetical protein IKL04_06615 [Lachnospiraceae bacterium]|nr:hypothetical protein [Lachnospiraceae bacterium]
MKTQQTKSTFMSPGAASLLTVFIVLCIAVFATLTLSGAKRDYTYSQQTAAGRMAYYEACNLSESVLHELDSLFAAAAARSEHRSGFFTNVMEALPDKCMEVTIKQDLTQDAPCLTWQIPIDENRALHTSITLQWPYDHTQPSGYYTVNTWQTIIINK